MMERKDCLLPDYQAAIDYESWRVAILNSSPQYTLDRLTIWQRHSQTDEVFVLLKGRCLLLVAGNDEMPGEFWGEELVPGCVYNVKRDVWHTHLLDENASVLIVENRNTSLSNSPVCPITDAQRRKFAQLWNKKGVSDHETEDL